MDGIPGNIFTKSVSQMIVTGTIFSEHGTNILILYENNITLAHSGKSASF